MPNVSFQLMPLTFNALAIESTNRCSARCAVCYQSSGPKGSDVVGEFSLLREEIERLIAEAIGIRSLVRRFHLAGGEAFLEMDDCLCLFNAARQAGYTDISATTNAFWAGSRKRAYEICRDLREAGLLRLEISCDYWHLEFVPAHAIENCIFACSEAGIDTQLRLLTTRSHPVTETLSLLSHKALAKVDCITSSPVVPAGRARSEIDDSEFQFKDELAGACHGVLNLAVNSRGYVYPCCAGLDQTEHVAFGNIRSDSLPEICERMNNSMMLRMLVFEGPRSFLPMLRAGGAGLSESHVNYCHLCFDIFSDERRVRIIEEQIEKIQTEALAKSIEHLKKADAIAGDTAADASVENPA